MKKSLESIIIKIVIIIFSLGVIFIIFINLNYIFSKQACEQEGYFLYESGSAYPQKLPICVSINETTNQRRYIELELRWKWREKLKEEYLNNLNEKQT